jgi:hypothetical protein
MIWAKRGWKAAQHLAIVVLSTAAAAGVTQGGSQAVGCIDMTRGCEGQGAGGEELLAHEALRGGGQGGDSRLNNIRVRQRLFHGSRQLRQAAVQLLDAVCSAPLQRFRSGINCSSTSVCVACMPPVHVCLKVEPRLPYGGYDGLQGGVQLELALRLLQRGNLLRRVGVHRGGRGGEGRGGEGRGGAGRRLSGLSSR